MIDLLVNRPSPHPRAPAHAFTLKMLGAKECTLNSLFYPFDVLSLSLGVTSHADMFINISNLVKHLHVQHVDT